MSRIRLNRRQGFAESGACEAGVLASMIPAGFFLERALGAAVNLHLIILSPSLVAALTALPSHSPNGNPAQPRPASLTHNADTPTRGGTLGGQKFRTNPTALPGKRSLGVPSWETVQTLTPLYPDNP